MKLEALKLLLDAQRITIAGLGSSRIEQPDCPVETALIMWMRQDAGESLRREVLRGPEHRVNATRT
jgi:hypothetical protein